MKNDLIELGFTDYEAKAYIALLQKNPATAYEIAKNAAIPTSKIYEVLIKLAEKGVISEFEENTKRKYIPMDPEEMLDSYRSKIDNTLNRLKTGLKNINQENELAYIWNIMDYEYLIDKAKRMIDEAEKTLLISIWPEEYGLLQANLGKATKLGVKTAVIHFGQISSLWGQCFPHPIEDTIYAEKGGRGLVIVADSQEVLFGKIGQSNEVQGANSMNEGFVAIAEDYIKHDIYIMKIVRRFDQLLIERFGPNYQLLRDVYNDQEVD
ncbi:MAG TPA: helix-turn-helix domain-containing protein [Bacillota bacterium]|nr:helix-turn-helix domain-containing protein [Bacillota bacterium]